MSEPTETTVTLPTDVVLDVLREEVQRLSNDRITLLSVIRHQQATIEAMQHFVMVNAGDQGEPEDAGKSDGDDTDD